jgi:hypothetical protein
MATSRLQLPNCQPSGCCCLFSSAASPVHQTAAAPHQHKPGLLRVTTHLRMRSWRRPVNWEGKKPGK